MTDDWLLSQDRAVTRITVTVYAEDMAIRPQWYRVFSYVPDDATLVPFYLCPTKIGAKKVVVSFFRGAHWLATVPFVVSVNEGRKGSIKPRYSRHELRPMRPL